jgi:hypothetical protein
MNITVKFTRVTAIAAVAIALFVGARPANAQVTRLAENMSYVGGPGFFTYQEAYDGGTGGSLFYANRITVPPGANTLFVDLTGVVALEGESDAALFTCTIDSSLLCVPQGSPDANLEPLGWIALSTLSYNAQPAKISFNTIHMTWCIPPGRYTQGGTQHTIGLRIAVPPMTMEPCVQIPIGVLLQQAKVNIDAVQISDTTNACTGKGFLARPLD